MIFIHGGAFVGGTLAPYDESLKMFVDKFAVKVISIDYRLLPENAIPHRTAIALTYWNI